MYSSKQCYTSFKELESVTVAADSLDYCRIPLSLSMKIAVRTSTIAKEHYFTSLKSITPVVQYKSCAPLEMFIFTTSKNTDLLMDLSKAFSSPAPYPLF